MASHPLHIDDIAPPPTTDAEGGGTSAVDVWKSTGGDVRIGIWKAAPGHYGAAGRGYAETFIVIDGEADVTIGAAPPRPVRAGSIVHVPAGAAIRFDVRRTLAKFSTTADP